MSEKDKKKGKRKGKSVDEDDTEEAIGIRKKFKKKKK